jgi:protein-disulfide isomerase
MSAIPTVSTQELVLAFASLRRLAFAAVFSAVAFAANGALAAGAAPEPDRTMDMATVLKPGPLPELTVGDPSGVPIVEYGSLTCPHCATFSREVFPELKKDYIDTGKIRFIFREFSRNPTRRSPPSSCFFPSRTSGRSSTSRSSR